jgi:hypothetical protein
MIKVYQIQLTNAEIDMVNSGETSDRIKAYFDRNFEGTFKAENFQYYTHVANVNTNDMEEAFTAMNLWDEGPLGALVERVDWDRRCSSMSVGDILEMEDGTKFRCASFGFEQMENYQRD